MDLETDLWNSEIYANYLNERTLPAIHLLSHAPSNFNPKVIYDLGCGPGNSTFFLKHRFKNASITGIDTSPSMLQKAKESYPDLKFINLDINQFSSHEKADLLFANASLQWLDDHEILFPRLGEMLNDKGILAVQMPNNFHAATHQTIVKILEETPQWISLLQKLRYNILRQPLYQLTHYYNILHQSDLQKIKCWETEYYHEMSSHEEIFRWLEGTGLRPILKELTENEQDQFSNMYTQYISTLYPFQENGKVLLPFRRIFMMGQKIN